jgi:hypothetical protein
MAAAEEAGRYWGAPSVYAHAPDRREIARGEPVRDGWLRFQLSDADYQQLAGDPDVNAIAVVDRTTSRIMGVKFLYGVSEIADRPVTSRRDELNAAVMEAIRAYRESHSFRSPLFAPSGLRSTYRPSESEQTCRWGSLRPQPAEDILTFRGR